MSSSSIARSSWPSNISRSPANCPGPSCVGRWWRATSSNATSAATASAPPGASDQLHFRPNRAPPAFASARSRACTRRWRVAASSSRTLASNACFAPRSNSLHRSDSVRRSFMPMLLAVLSEQLAQSVHGARVMCLHAPFGAVHRERGLRNVESLEIAHRERLALPRRQYRERLLERLHRVVREHPVERVVRRRTRRGHERVVLLA